MFKKFSFLLIFLPALVVAQHTIKGNFSPAEDYEWAILYQITPATSIYIDNIQVDKQGSFEFQLDSTATQGMYKIVYALPQEEYNFDIIYNAKEDVELNFNQETGIEFKSSIENQLVASYTNSMSLVSQSIGNFYQQESTDSLALASIFTTQKETQTNFEAAAEGTLASHFIKANRPYIPEEFEGIKIYINNLKIHFFDNVDFNNKILQTSNFLIERNLNYVFGMSSEMEDDSITYKKNINDVFLAMADANPEIKSTLLEVLWQQMVDTGFEDVANYISDKYLISLAEELNDTELVDGLIQFKNLSLGKRAPDFSFEIENGEQTTTTSLYDIETSERYVIVFWSSTCSHCLEEVPLLQSYIKTSEIDKVQVIAIGLEDKPKRWQREILNYPEFIHVLGLGKWTFPLVKTYNVTSTPTYYVLDKDKNIIAKPYNFEALKKFQNQK